MAESAAHSPDTQKRRTSRIVQAVPLTVMGVDALGRPFHERTSTLIINCHGCRYQSKHYVLKNMWVTIEVPHPEPGRGARQLRARVMWIQRPRTVRELFQIGIELETPGNLWAIAFPPPDWFPFPESDSAQETRPFAPMSEPSVEMSGEEWTGGPGSELSEHNVRTMPGGTVAEPSHTLAHEFQLLLDDAKQQLHAAARESASDAVSSEAQLLLASLDTQMKMAADSAMEAAAVSAADQAMRAALRQAEQAQTAYLEALRNRWIGEAHESIERAAEKLQVRLDEIERDRNEALDQQIDSRLQQKFEKIRLVTDDLNTILSRAQEGLETFRNQAGQSTAALAREFEEAVAGQRDAGRAQLAELDNATRRIREEIEASAEAARSGWHGRLEADFAAAGSRWDERIAASMESAVQRMAERISTASRFAAEQAEFQVGERVASLHEALAQATAEAEGKLASARTLTEEEIRRVQLVLDQVQSEARELEQQAGTLDDTRRAGAESLVQQAGVLIETQSHELDRRAKENITAWIERLDATMGTVAQESVARFAADFDQQFASQIAPASDALARLESLQREAHQSVRDRQEELARTSQEAIDAAVSRLNETVARLESQFEDGARAAAAKWLTEVDAKATETSHAAFESLFKTSEWYEKKVQTQMQTTLERGIEQAGGVLREKAREISGIFAAELDHYSRSYVEHTQGQFEDAARDTLERMGQRSSEMAATWESGLQEQSHQHTEEVAREFRRIAGAMLEEASAQMAAHAERFDSTLGGEAQRAAAEFRASLALRMQQAAESVQQELSAHAASAKGDLREAAAVLASQAMAQYEARLENASNSWLLITLTKLNQQSQQHLDALEHSSEERLRGTCRRVFTEVGDALRRRMLDALPAPTEEPPADPL